MIALNLSDRVRFAGPLFIGALALCPSLGCDDSAVGSADATDTDDDGDDDGDDPQGTTSGDGGDDGSGGSASSTGSSPPPGETTGEDPCDACDPMAQCRELECVCPSGYSGDGLHCADIDECAEALDDCHPNATCTNTQGAFECTCDPGYVGDGRDCTSATSCADSPCDANATCVDTQQGFECECNDGFEGDGFECSGDGQYGETCTEAEVCASGLCVTDPYFQCSESCTQAVVNDCANVGASGFCIPLAGGDFGCVGELDTGFDTDDAILLVGDSVTRAMDTLTDADMFQLATGAGDFDIVVTPAETLDVRLDVHNGIGQPIGSLNEAGAGEAEAGLLTAGAGTTFAVVRNEGLTTGLYTISLVPAP